MAAISVAPSRDVARAASRRSDLVSIHALLAELRRADPSFQLATTKDGLSRGGVLSAGLLVSLLLVLVADAGRHGYQTLLDDFWEDARTAGIALPAERAPAAASFCNARKRLRPEVVLAALHLVAGRVLARRSGRRFFAVDATRRNVRRSAELWSACRSVRWSGSPQVQVSVLYELDAELPCNVEVGPFDASERAQCLAHLAHLRAGDVLILDRGYPGFELLREIGARGIDFIARIATSSTFPAVERFLASGRNDAVIEIAPSARFRRSRPKQEHIPLRVRAVRLAGPDRRPVVLLTSLSRAHFARSALMRLYRRRWRIEEHFKLLKCGSFGQGQMHAKSLAGVRQEIFAQALHVAITRLLATAASHGPRSASPAADHVHLKDAVHALGRVLVQVLLCRNEQRIAAVIAQLRQRMLRRARPPRPGRAHPRRSFRPCSKWASTGRRGTTTR